MKKLCLIFGICCVASSGCFGKDAYRFLSEIPIGGEGGWDILTIDPTANRLYLSHATKVVVVDLAKNSVIGEITDTPGVHAFVAVPELQRGFSSNGKEDKASVVDLKTLQTTSKIDTGPNPDAIVYEPKRHEVYVFNHTGNSCTVIDPKSASVITTIQLGGSPEFAAVDKAAGRIYCNIEDKSEVAVIDTSTHEVIARWVVVDLNTNSVTGEIADTPGVHAFVAVPEVQRGFSSNGKESKSSVVDLTTLKTTSKIDTGSNPDAVVYEPRHGEVYVFNHTGNSVTVINCENRYCLSDDSARRNSRIRGGR